MRIKHIEDGIKQLAKPEHEPWWWSEFKVSPRNIDATFSFGTSTWRSGGRRVPSEREKGRMAAMNTRAHQLLKKLAKDPSMTKLMRRHNLSTNVLAELPWPERFMELQGRKIAIGGYNQLRITQHSKDGKVFFTRNSTKITVLLRHHYCFQQPFDFDVQGLFIPFAECLTSYDAARHILLHELAHCRYDGARDKLLHAKRNTSDHQEASFRQFERRLQRDYNEIRRQLFTLARKRHQKRNERRNTRRKRRQGRQARRIRKRLDESLQKRREAPTGREHGYA